MKILQSNLLFAATILFPTVPALAAEVVVAGSHLMRPPPFLDTSFWGVTAAIDRAFPFEVTADGPYRLRELQVAAHRYSPPTGAMTAEFALHFDDNGRPGASFATFALNSIPAVAQILTMTPQGSGDVVLHSHTPYWIVGSTTQGQVNWNLAPNKFGAAAYRVAGAEWILLSSSNVSAFALSGTRISEPSAFGLCYIVSAILITRRGRGWQCKSHEP